ncbi:innexin shaking-B [Folsomia candida]|nr:innexin shaking-B [Folsomia candida]
MQGEVSYPGVSGYRKDRDGVIRQRYYKIVWMILVKLAIFSFLPYFFWRARGVTKIKPLLDVSSDVTEDITEHEIRVKFFLESVGFNDTFGIYYIFCKLFATLTPVGEYVYLCGVIGPRYRYFGVQVFAHFLDETAPWPNPMDVLFPKMAKCNWIVYGFGGDSEVKSAICQLPMNNLTQWTFFVFWWWMAFTFVVNILSLLRVSLFMCGLYRRFSYRKFVSRACRDDVEKGRSSRDQGTGKLKKFSKSDIIMVKLSFGDVMVLSFIKRNLQEWEFRELIRTLVTTKNHVLQMRSPTISKPHKNPLSFKKAKQEKLEMGFIMPNSSSPQISIAPSAPLPYSDQSTEIIIDEQEEDSISSDPLPPVWPVLKAPVKVERRSTSKDLESKSKNKTKDKKNTGSFSTWADESASNSNTTSYHSSYTPANANYNTDDNGTDADWA